MISKGKFCKCAALRLKIQSGNLELGKKWKERSHVLLPLWIAASFGDRNESSASLTSIKTTPILLSVSRRHLHSLSSFICLSTTKRRDFVQSKTTTQQKNRTKKQQRKRKSHLGISQKTQNELRLHVPEVALVCSDREISVNNKHR